ncbi:MAG TPA: radical SAM protein [Acidobacteriota bacterium]|nr:radical SAM protein [Acidobacteriota bacterium]
MRQNKFKSYNTKSLCEGCKSCVEGKKSVIYVTGLCPRRCFYCPLSEQRRNTDVMYVNEKKVTTISQIIDEIRISCSHGAGITGGDPLVKLDRTCEIICAIKETFGKEFHVHLYTSLVLLNEERIQKLYASGLDEIRVHPDFEKTEHWPRIHLLKKFNWRVGIEIPVIPDFLAQTKDLLKTYGSVTDFINLNELELTHTNAEQLQERHYRLRDDSFSAVDNSKECALGLLQEFADLPLHFCTARLKNSVQYVNRIKRRAKSIVKSYEALSKDGTILQGIIQATPSDALILELRQTYEIPSQLLFADVQCIRIAPWVLLHISKKLPYECILRTVYPTADAMVVAEEVLPSKNKRILSVV